MRKSNWIVAAIAAVACGVLLWAWFALGFNHVDDPLDLIVAIVWWLAVAAVVGGIVWAEGKRREKMRLAFVGEGVVYNPEAGLVMPDAGESELAALERTLSGMAFPRRGGRPGRADVPRLPLGGALPQVRPQRRGLGGRGRHRPRPGRRAAPVRVPRGPGRPAGGVGRGRDLRALRGRDIANRQGGGARQSAASLYLQVDQLSY